MKLLTIGDNNVDTYSSGISYPGGNCPNVAAYARINGWDSAYIGVVGNDPFGDLQVDGLRALGVDTSHIRRENGYTSRDIIVLNDNDRVFTNYDRSIIDNFPVSLAVNEYDYVRSFDLIHSSIYSVFRGDTFTALCSLGVPVSFDFSIEWDPDYSPEENISDIAIVESKSEDYIKSVCQKVDFGFFSCSHLDEVRTKEILKKMHGFGLKIAVATRGMHGSWTFDGTDYFYQPAYKVPVVDTLGAGDSFITRFLISYFEGKSLFKKYAQQFNNTTYGNVCRNDFEKKLIQYSMSTASLFAASSCQLEGAFGFGKRLR